MTTKEKGHDDYWIQFLIPEVPLLGGKSKQIDTPQTDNSLPVLPQLLPHPSLPFSGLCEEGPVNSITWTSLSNGSGWVMSVEITAEVKGLEKREVDSPSPTPILGVKSLDHISGHIIMSIHDCSPSRRPLPSLGSVDGILLSPPQLKK